MAGLKPLYRKKSQSRIQEMIFMILAIAIFFILVFLFYLAVSLGNIKKTAETGARSGAIMLIAGLAGSPEFNCAESAGVCVDSDKLIVLSNYSEYSRFWNVAGLRVERVYPLPEKKIICNRFNYPKCNTYVIIASKSQNVIRDESYVSLCRIENKDEHRYTQCDLGKIIVETEKKT